MWLRSQGCTIGLVAKRDIYHLAYADSKKKVFLFCYIFQLIKNIRKNLLDLKKFAFSSFQFNLFCDTIDVPKGFIWWCICHEVYERDGKLQGHFRKAPKVTYQTIHHGYKKQSIELALVVFHEAKIAPIRNYFSYWLDVVDMFPLFIKMFVICHAKQRFNLLNKLGNAIG